MIDEKKLIEEFKKIPDRDWYTPWIVDVINEQPKVNYPLSDCVGDCKSCWKTKLVNPQWIPCSERLPEERESVFKKFKGTSKWCEAMFEGISDDVNVTVEFEDGTRTTKVSHTLDGKWKCEKDYGIKMKVIAWKPLLEPYKEGDT